MSCSASRVRSRTWSGSSVLRTTPAVPAAKASNITRASDAEVVMPNKAAGLSCANQAECQPGFLFACFVQHLSLSVAAAGSENQNFCSSSASAAAAASKASSFFVAACSLFTSEGSFVTETLR